MILYHGSNIDIKDEFLKPHNPFVEYGYSNRICFSTDENVALLYSINPIKSYSENLQTKEENIPAFSVHLKLNETPYLIYELYEGMFEELFNKTCYIYKCDVDDSIIKNANNGFEKYVEQKVDITKKIIVENCLQKLKELEKQGNLNLMYFHADTVYALYDELENKAYSVKTETERDFIENKCRDFNINIESVKKAMLL